MKCRLRHFRSTPVSGAEVTVKWDVIATAVMKKECSLLPLLRECGDLRGPGFKDVLSALWKTGTLSWRL